MAKSKRRFSDSSVGGPARPESPRRSFRPSEGSAPPPQRPPAGGTRPVGAPRPLVPEKRSRGPFSGLVSRVGGGTLVVAVVALVVVAVVGLLGYAWYDSKIEPARAEAMSVGDRTYSMDYFAKRLRGAIDDAASSGNSPTQEDLLTTIPNQVKDAIARESTALQRAGTLGVEVGSNEVDREMISRLGLPTVDGDNQPVSGDDAFVVTPQMESILRGQLQKTGYTLGKYRQLTETQVLIKKIQEYFIENAPRQGPQVRVQLIQLPSESDAKIATQKIQSGENTFEELANTVSLDQLGKGKDGLRDWQPRGIMGKALDDVAFTLPVNSLSSPIDAGEENGWFLMKVLERVDNRDITDDVRRRLGENNAKEWFDQQRNDLGVKDKLTQGKLTWALTEYPPAFLTTPTLPGTTLPQGNAPGGQSVPISLPPPAAPPQPAGSGSGQP